MPSVGRRNQRGSADTAKVRLWRELRELFEDEDGVRHAGPDVGFDDLRGADLLRLWDHVCSHARSVSKREVWDRNNEPADEPLTLADARTLLARGELGYVSVHVDGLEPHRLPLLVFEFWRDAVSMYWWVADEGWNTKTAAALAELLGELHALVPHSRLAYDDQSDVDEFWGPVSRYLATIR